MKTINKFLCASLLIVVAWHGVSAQSPAGRSPDISNKALITKSAPTIDAAAFKNQNVKTAIPALHKLAYDYYAWRKENYPVNSSDAGLHTWDDRLTDYSPAKIDERAKHVHGLLEKLRAMKIENWPKDERIDAILFRAQLEDIDFGNRVL